MGWVELVIYRVKERAVHGGHDCGVVRLGYGWRGHLGRVVMMSALRLD